MPTHVALSCPPMSQPLSIIHTPRLELIPASIDLAKRVVEFYQRNEPHLTPWEPPKPLAFDTEIHQRNRLAQAEQAAKDGTAVRWWLCLRNEPNVLVGSIGLTAIVRGGFQNAMLGYAIDEKFQGQGLMQEALAAAIEYAFSTELNLHRIQANVRPENLRSLKLLERLGFEREGYAKDYLFIHDAWHDHVMFALRNENFKGNLV